MSTPHLYGKPSIQLCQLCAELPLNKHLASSCFPIHFPEMPHGESARSYPMSYSSHGIGAWPQALAQRTFPCPILLVLLFAQIVASLRYFPSPCSILGQDSMCLVLYGPNAETLLALHDFQEDRVWPTCSIWQQYWHTKLHVLSISPLFQLKVDEFESNVNEIKDPYPSADFPGKMCPWQPSRKGGEELQRDGARILAV